MQNLRVLNLGAGVQSTTVALMGIKNWEAWHCSESLPYEPVGLIDYAIFADTQEEPRSVYAHLSWLENKCARFFPILKRTAGKLGDDLMKGIPVKRMGTLHERRFVSIPGFLKDAGMLPRQCTRDYKIAVINRTIKREILDSKKASVDQLFGLSYEEAGRIVSVKARNDQPFELHFPLFEMEMTRAGCKTWLKKQQIPHEVPRSACVFCPYHSNEEWRRIKEVPEDWARAVEIDSGLRNGSAINARAREYKAFVHKDCVALTEADLDDPETREGKRGQEMFGFLQECEGMCGV